MGLKRQAGPRHKISRRKDREFVNARQRQRHGSSKPGRTKDQAFGNTVSTSRLRLRNSSASIIGVSSPVASAITRQADSDRSIEISATFAEPFQSFWTGWDSSSFPSYGSPPLSARWSL